LPNVLPAMLRTCFRNYASSTPSVKHSELKYAVCPEGYREDHTTKQCIQSTQDHAHRVSQKEKATRAQTFQSSSKVRPKPGTYWVGEDGQCFLTIDRSSECSNLFVLKGIPEDVQPRNKQPWLKRMMSQLRTPQIWLSDRSRA
jgi:hypothetical protein